MHSSRTFGFAFPVVAANSDNGPYPHRQIAAMQKRYLKHFGFMFMGMNLSRRLSLHKIN